MDNYKAIVDGVAEVFLMINIAGEETGVAENAMLTVANEKHGNLESQVDLILLFVPTSTMQAATTD